MVISLRRYNKFALSVIGAVPKRILEIGCGNGRILVPMARAGHDATV